MALPFAPIRRTLISVHRWLGVGLSVVFLLWFPSGIAMIYWDFPAVTPADRLERAAPLDPASIRLLPAQASGILGLTAPPAEARLNTFDGRPVYRFLVDGRERVVFADTGEPRAAVSETTRLRIASAWTRQPPDNAAVTEIREIDQWTVTGGLRNLRPLWKYSWPDGQEVYVAGATGEVVQYSTRGSRLGAYLGPIPHWFYFTPLRKHQLAWTRTVVWVSGLATVAAVMGLAIGAWQYSPRRRYRHNAVPSRIPHHGQKRRHAVLGLVFGVGAATWVFSGMLSMDPFPRSADNPRVGSPAVGQLRRTADLAAFSAKPPDRALQQVGAAVTDLELVAVAGEPLYIATLAGARSRVVPLHDEPRSTFDARRLIDVFTDAAAPAVVVDAGTIDEYDTYYRDRRRQRPLPVIAIVLGDVERTRYYIDPATARVVGVYGRRDWVDRWLYQGLHSLDFPWLGARRPFWDIVVITFMVGGTALSVTSVILAWRLVTRMLVRVFAVGR